MKGLRVAVIGASGAIGAALAQCYRRAELSTTLFVYSRQRLPDLPPEFRWGELDLLEERSIAAAAAHAAREGPLDRILICSGILHTKLHRPEKSLSEIDAAWLQQNFAINCIGPALVLKHFLPQLNRNSHAVCAVLSARLGSISDNRLGGWYSYRASKAALNMLITTAAIELRRTHPAALLIGLHPGTVDSPLSAPPYRINVPEKQLQSPEEAAAQLLQVVENSDIAHSGRCLSWDGSVIPA